MLRRHFCQQPVPQIWDPVSCGSATHTWPTLLGSEAFRIWVCIIFVTQLVLWRCVYGWEQILLCHRIHFTPTVFPSSCASCCRITDDYAIGQRKAPSEEAFQEQELRRGTSRASSHDLWRWIMIGVKPNLTLRRRGFCGREVCVAVLDAWPGESPWGWGSSVIH